MNQHLMLAASHLSTFGYVTLRQHIDTVALAAEFEETMHAAFDDSTHLHDGIVGNQFRYVPMMCEHTPTSVGLVTELATVAEHLLGCTVLPGRAKATTYVGSASWHRDTDLPVRSIGFLAYLEPLTSDTGALCVIAGTHRDDYAAAVTNYLALDPTFAGIALSTRPGDLIVFDEHLYHASSGGDRRRQWRIDFIADDVADRAVSEWYLRQLAIGWDPGYDIGRYPSYGPRSTHAALGRPRRRLVPFPRETATERNVTMNVNVQVETTIGRPVLVVAAYTSDPFNAPRWYRRIDTAVWVTQPPVQVGSLVTFRAKFLGKELVYTYEIVELTPAVSLTMRTAQGPFPMETTYTWSAITESSTRMTLRNYGQPTGFSRFTAPLMSIAMKSAMAQDLRQLKAILETA